MIEFALAIVCLALAVLGMVMQKTYYYLPARELKRQAGHHDPLATILWRAVGYGAALRVLLWLITVVGAGIGLVLLINIAPTPLAIVAVGLLLLFTFAWLPNTRLTSLGGRITVWATPPLVWLLRQSSPLLSLLHRQARRYVDSGHTGLYEHEDLEDLLSRQKRQPDNRIGHDELDIARAALSFGSKRVRDILIVRKRVKTVAATEDIGPIMLDELHKSHHSRFPVYEGKKDNFVGLLYLHDLVDRKSTAHHKVADLMVPHVYYMHESDSLTDALQTFYQTKHQLFVVVNSFDEFLGIISLEDVLAQLMGEPVITHMEQSDNRQSVAARHPKQQEVSQAEDVPPASEDEYPDTESPHALEPAEALEPADQAELPPDQPSSIDPAEPSNSAE